MCGDGRRVVELPLMALNPSPVGAVAGAEAIDVRGSSVMVAYTVRVLRSQPSKAPKLR